MNYKSLLIITSFILIGFINISAQITLNLPNGGELIKSDTVYTITWTSSDPNIQNVRIDYSSNNGSSWRTIVSSTRANNGSYNWNTSSATYNPSEQGLIRIRDVDNSANVDISNNNFTLFRLNITDPNLSTAVLVGDSYSIRWIASSDISTINLYYSIDNAPFELLEPNLSAGLQIYNWETTSDHLSGNIRLMIQDANNSNKTDISSAFRVSDLQITSPLPGEEYYVGEPVPISWSANNVQFVDLEYSPDGGNSWITIVSNYNASLQSYDWNNPNPPSGEALLRVVDSEASNIISTMGNIFSVSTVTITSPQPNEGWEIGSSQTIQWTTNVTNTINILLSTDNGNTWRTLRSNVNPALGSISYNVEDIPTSLALIKIQFDGNNGTLESVMADNFTIGGIDITSPAGGEVWQAGQVYDIEYDVTNGINVIGIEYTTNGTNWNTITNNTSANGSYSWSIPSNLSASSLFLRVFVPNTFTPYNISTTSDPITISNLRLTSPVGGEAYESGTALTISWTNNSAVTNLTIEYSQDGGATWNIIQSGVNAQDNFYIWSIPELLSSNQMQIRLTSESNPNFISTSNNFKIGDISIGSPNGGEVLYGANIYPITWSATNSVQTVRLEYSTNGGSSFININNAVDATSGNYNWTVPNLYTTRGKIRISDTYGNAIDDTSANDFTIARLQLTSPNGGEGFKPGEVTAITWVSDAVSNVSISYSLDNGSSWTQITGSVPADQETYNWTIPNNLTAQGLIRIRSLDDPDFEDVSDANFKIASINLLNPNGGENYQTGSSQIIEWNASSNISGVDIDLSTDNGSSWNRISSFVSGASTYNWTVNNAPTNNALIRVTDAQFPDISDISDAVFSIERLRLVSPNGGELFLVDSVTTITWSSSAVSNVKLEYSINNGTNWTQIVASTPAAAQSYNWTIPNFPSTEVLVRISDSDNPSDNISDQSDAVFSINRIYVSNPNGGESYSVNSTETITWISHTSVNNVIIEFSNDNGNSWSTVINAYSAASGSYQWTLPNVVTNQALIRIRDVDDTNVFDVSNSPFAIGTISLTAPNGGEHWQVDDTHQITWNTINSISFVDIEYSVDNGVTWLSVVNNYDATLESYNWQVPNNTTGQALVRISDANNASFFDRSNNVFSIADINVTTPNGGEEYQVGEVVNIEWLASNVSRVNLAYSVDNGSTWNTFATNFNANDGTYEWTIPTNAASETALIRVVDAQYSNVDDISDANFRIVSINLTSPNGGEGWQTGDVESITWSHSGINNVNIDYSVDGINWTSIVTNYNADLLSYDWTIPSVESNQVIVRIEDALNSNFNDVSDANFVIGDLSINNPTAASNWKSGQNYEISWNATAGLINVGIDYSTDGGANWINIINSFGANIESYFWTIPGNIATSNARIRVRHNQSTGSNIFAVSDVFNINSLQLIFPNGGDYLQSGTTETITWASSVVQSLLIEYSPDNGNTWTTLANNYPADANSFSWEVPSNYSTKLGLIKLTDVNNSNIYVESNNNFKVGWVQVLAPARDSIWQAGFTKQVRWDYSNSIDFVNVYYSLDGSSWTQIASNISASDSLFNWTIQNNPSSSTSYIRITDAMSNLNIQDISEPFELVYLNLLSPNGGENLQNGKIHPITWSASNLIDFINISYSINSGQSWIPIASNIIASSGSYNWSIPSNLTSTNIRIRINDAGNSDIYDISTSAFTINNLLVTSPVLDQEFQIGKRLTINWNSTNLSNIDIALSLDGGLNFTRTIASNIPSSLGTYVWVIPTDVSSSNQAVVRISSTSNSATNDLSDQFVLKRLDISSPDGGEIWQTGTTHDITWNSGQIENIDIYFSSNGGIDWTLLVDNYDDIINDSYSWNIPNNTTTNALIKLVDSDNPSISDSSSSAFSISTFGLTSPIGGEIWQSGKVKKITWSIDNNQNISVQYSSNNGGTWTTLTTLAGDIGEYNWTIPETYSTSEAKIRILRNTNGILDSAFISSGNRFTIKRLTLTSPSSQGLVFQAGKSTPINFISGQVDSVLIDYSLNNGVTWTQLIGLNSNSTQTYSWSIPSGVTTSQGRIRIRDANFTNIKDSSDNSFAIGNLVLTTPSGGEQWQTGIDSIITWTSSGISNVTLQYRLSNSSQWQTIETVAASLGSYTWDATDVNGNPISSNQASIRVHRENDESFNSQGNIFTIKRLDITSPVAGAIWQTGEVKNITWNSAFVTNLNISYSTNNGTNWNTITNGYNATLGTFSWTVPSATSSQVRIRLIDANNSKVLDISDQFTIGALLLTSPEINDQYQTGKSMNITWNSVGLSNISLEYSKDNGSSWSDIVRNIAAELGEYNWNIPDDAYSNEVIVRISGTSGANQLKDESGLFVIKRLNIDIPNSADIIWQANTQKTIQWTSNFVNQVLLYYSTNSGTNWIAINNGNPIAGNLNQFNWTVPNLTTSTAKIKVVDASNSAISDSSSNNFSIGSLVLTVPVLSQEVQSGKQLVISWNSVGINNVKIEYSIDNSTWVSTPIASSIASELGSFTWDIPADLYSQQARIRITSIEDDQISDVSDLFIIKRLSLDTPDGGQLWQANTEHAIEWTSNFVNQIKLFYSTNNGINWLAINGGNSISANLGSYNWIVPNVTSSNMKIKIEDASNSSISDSSSNTFTTGSIIVIAPALSEEIQSSKSYIIRWNSISISDVKIEYSLNNGLAGSWITIEESIAGDLGSYNWNVPANISTQQARVRITLVNDSSIFDISDLFVIKQLDLIVPNGGEVWQANSIQPITWRSGGITSALLYYTTNNGDRWIPFNENPIISSDTTTINWTVPNINSSQARIRIIDANNLEIRDSSSNSFTIGNLSITSPNAGTEWQANTNHNITWTSSNLSNVRLDYSTNNGNNWLPIINSIAANLGSYNWNIPESICSQEMRVRVASLDSTIYSISPTFTVKDINITYPLGGELVLVDDDLRINWNTCDIQNVNLYYTLDGGVNWIELATNIPAANATYLWNLNDNFVSDEVAVRIVDADNFSIASETGLFTIGYLRITSPNLSTVWQAGRIATVEWESANINSIRVQYSDDNISYSSINNNVSASLGELNWNIDNSLYTNEATIRLIINGSNPDTIVSPEFTIKYLDLLTPNGNENWLAGTNRVIEWNSQLVGTIGILISTNAGTSWDTIRANHTSPNTFGGNEFNYLIPQDYASNEALVKIFDIANPTVSDSSEDYFNINSLLLTNPNGGERLQAGRTYQIQYINSNNTTSIRADYSTNGMLTWLPITTSHNANEPLLWTIPETAVSNNSFIRIIDNDNEVVADSSEVFTIARLSLTNPIDLVYWQNRTQKIISWNSTYIDSIDIDYSLDAGNSWSNIISTLANGSSSYNWTIPNNINSDEARIRIVDTRDNTILSSSGADFVIGDVQVLSPNNGEILNAGTTIPITYSYSNSVSSVKLEYSLDNGSNWFTIIENSPASGTYNWLIDADIISDQCLIRISHADSELQIVDVSDAVFTITALRIVSPNGGENFQVGDNVTIEWNSVASLNTVNLDYQIKGENSWRFIGQNIPANQGSFVWNIPNTPSDSILIRLSDQNDANFYDLSNDYIRIGNVQLISPNGGEKWQVGSQHLIEWSSSSNVNEFEIFTSTDQLNWRRLTEVNNASSYNWSISNIIPGNYYVKIQDRNSNQVINDSSSSFFTISNIAINQPIAGDTWLAGSTQTIKWSNSSDIDSLEIKYSLNGGITWIKLDSLNGADKEYSWTIPTNISSSSVILALNDYNYPDIIGRSGTFNIVNQGITLIQPNGGEFLTAGQNYDITWNASPEIQNVRIERSLDDGATWQNIILSTPNDGIYSWTISSSISSQQALIRISDALNPFINDISDDLFAIGNLSIVNPNGGEVILSGSNHNIIWTALPSVNQIDLYFRENDNESWVKINQNGTINAQDLTYTWNVPNTESEQAKIRIVDANSNGAIFAESNDYFSIRTINVLQPNGGEFLASGLPYEIRWYASSSIQNVVIERSLDSGATFITLQTTTNDGSYNWSVPSDIESSLALIRIRAASNANIVDTSDATFTISNLAVLSPNNGEVLRAGLIKNIRWRATNFINQVNLFYRENDNSAWRPINTNGPINAQDLLYPWTVPVIETEQAKIKIEDANSNGAIYAESNGYFSIRIINVQTPNGGEFASSGMPFTINWNASASIENVKIQYSIDSGATYTNIVNPDLSSTSNDGSAIWNIPSNFEAPYAFIRIMDAANNSIADTSDSYFSISNLSVVSPNDGEHLQGGKSARIRWAASSTIDSVNLFFRPNDAVAWIPINPDPIEAGLGVYTWPAVPNTATQNAKIKVVDAASSGLVYDESDNYFTISILTLTSPSGGLIVQNNNIIDISWANSNDISQVSLEYQLNPTSAWQAIGTGPIDAALGTYSWNLNGIECTDDLLIRISDFAFLSIKDTSNNPINVAKLDMTNPVGGEDFQIGSILRIEWDYCNFDSVVVLRSINGGDTFSPIDTVDASQLRYNWIVDVPTTDQNRIKLTALGAQNITSESGDFTTFEPIIDLLYPNGGEHFLAGRAVNIRWNNQWASSIRIDLFDGNTWIEGAVTESISSINGIFTYNLPADFETDSAKIRIVDLANPSYQDSSNNYFTVSRLELISPDGGNYWEAGNERAIEWYASETLNNLKVELYLEDTLNATISPNIDASLGSLTYIIPESQYSSKARIKLYYADSIYSQSENYFKIGYITLNKPVEQEIYQAGRIIPIIWDQSPNINQYQIDLVDLHDSSIVRSKVINNQIDFDNWLSNSDLSIDSAVFIISDRPSNYQIADTSGVFSIRRLNITAPVAGANWSVGTTQKITWNVSPEIDSVAIEYSLDGSVFQPITDDIYVVDAQLGEYNWAIPSNITSPSSFIRIFDSQNDLIADTSEQFNIYISSLAVQYPNQAECFNAGQQVPIAWSSGFVSSVILSVSYDNGETWETLNNGQPLLASSSPYLWTVPSNASTTQGLIRVSNFSNPSHFDLSDVNFKVGWINIDSPVSGVIHRAGLRLPINISTSTSISEVGLFYSTVNNPTNEDLKLIDIVPVLNNNIQYLDWNTVDIESEFVKLWVKDNACSDRIIAQTGYFAIRKLEIISPTGGEFLSSGSNITIEWEKSASIPSLRVQYQDGNASPIIIQPSIQTGTQHTWSIPTNLVSNNVKIIVTQIGAPSISDTTDNFSIGGLSLLALINGEKVLEKKIQEIEWRATENIERVKIQYKTSQSSDWIDVRDKNGIRVESIAADTTHPFEWIIPETPSDDCYIRISDYNNPSVYVENQIPFTIARFILEYPIGGEYFQAKADDSRDYEVRINSQFVDKINFLVNKNFNSNPNSWIPVTLPVNPTGNYDLSSYLDILEKEDASGSYRISILDEDFTKIADTSDNFSVSYLKLLDPNGTSGQQIGTEYTIKWDVSLNRVNTVDIYVQTDPASGYDPTPINVLDFPNGIPASEKQYVWQINIPPTPNARIKIVDRDQPLRIYDESDNTFKISEIRLISPLAGDRYQLGKDLQIEWESTYINEVVIQYSIDDAPWRNIDPNIQKYTSGTTGGSIVWALSQTMIYPTDNLKIKVSDFDYSTVKDESGAFSVALLELDYPNERTAWQVDIEQTIKWKAEQISDFRILLDNGTTVKELGRADISNNTSSNNYEFLYTPNLGDVTNNATICIQDMAEINIEDCSDETFLIGTFPIITVDDLYQKGDIKFNFSFDNPTEQITLEEFYWKRKSGAAFFPDHSSSALYELGGVYQGPFVDEILTWNSEKHLPNYEDTAAVKFVFSSNFNVKYEVIVDSVLVDNKAPEFDFSKVTYSQDPIINGWNSVTVSWNPGTDSSLPITYTFNAKDPSQTEISNKISFADSTILNQLFTATKYETILTVEDDLGNSKDYDFGFVTRNLGDFDQSIYSPTYIPTLDAFDLDQFSQNWPSNNSNTSIKPVNLYQFDGDFPYVRVLETDGLDINDILTFIDIWYFNKESGLPRPGSSSIFKSTSESNAWILNGERSEIQFVKGENRFALPVKFDQISPRTISFKINYNPDIFDIDSLGISLLETDPNAIKLMYNDTINGVYHFDYTTLTGNEILTSGLEAVINCKYTRLQSSDSLGIEMTAFDKKTNNVSKKVFKYVMNQIPNQYTLRQNYPNPFNPTTTIEYEVPAKANVQIELYDILGQKVQTLVNNEHNPGIFKVTLDASKIRGGLASGVYFYRMVSNDFVQTKKILLIK